MTAQVPPYVLQASSHSAELFRRATLLSMTGAGVVGASDLKVTQDTGSNLKVQVAAGQIVIPGTLGSTVGMRANANVQSTFSPVSANFTTQGSYYAYNDSPVTLTLTSANVTNPRYDLIVATVLDSFYSGASNTWVPQIVTGTPAGTPLFPTIPANSVVLGFVMVAANATAITNSDISDVRPFYTASYMSQNVQQGFIPNPETTNSPTSTDLPTPGPSTTIVVPASGKIVVTLTAQMSVSTASSGAAAIMNFVSSGANTLTSSVFQQISLGAASGTYVQTSGTFLITGLSPGSTTFTAKYASSGASDTAGFAYRRIIVQAMP